MPIGRPNKWVYNSCSAAVIPQNLSFFNRLHRALPPALPAWKQGGKLYRSLYGFVPLGGKRIRLQRGKGGERTEQGGAAKIGDLKGSQGFP